MSNNDNKYIGIEVGGKDDRVWVKAKHKLLDAINNLLDFEIDAVNHSSIREEAQKLTSAGLGYLLNKLNKPGIENDKILSEIEESYSRIQKTQAETRKINAEADAIELENRLKKLRIALGATKILMLGEKGEEAILFLKEIESFQKLLDSYPTGDLENV